MRSIASYGKYAAALGLGRGYSAHSMRATFITTALENGAQLEDVQKAAGIVTPVRQSCTIAGVITPRKRLVSSPPTKNRGSPSAGLCRIPMTQ
jgi:hypothetical protein